MDASNEYMKKLAHHLFCNSAAVTVCECLEYLLQVSSAEARGTVMCIRSLNQEQMLHFQQILEDDSKLKLFHDFARAAKYLPMPTGRITNVFDTQVN